MNERISLMDRFQMNRSGCRPYQYTCGMNSGMAGRTDRSFSDMAKQVPHEPKKKEKVREKSKEMTH